MKPIFRYTLKVLKILLIVFVVLYVAAYVYVVSNKKKIISQVTEQISKKLNGTVKIGDADISFFRSFPGISVLVNNISLTDTMFAQHQHPFFSAKEVFVKINVYKLIQKESPLTGLRVDNASIYLYTDTSGYTNTYMLQSKKDPAGGPKKTSDDINLKSIDLNNVRITLEDKKREKFHDFNVKSLAVSLNDDGTNLILKTDANILVNSLAFNLPRGTFLKAATFEGDFKLQYGKKSQQLRFDSIDVDIAGHPFNLSGNFDLGDKNPAFKLAVHVKDVLYNDVKKLLPARIDSSLSIVALDKPIQADAELSGPLQGGDPYILAKWKVQNSHLSTPFLDFDNASFTGFYNNEVTAGLPRKDPNSVISISNFKAEWRTLPVNSNKIVIMNLSVPVLDCDLRSAFAVQKLNDVIPTNSIDFAEGDADVKLDYKGPIAKNDNTNSFLNGSIIFKNGKIIYNPREAEMKDLNGTILFSNSNIFVQDFRFNLLNNKIVMNGTANNLLTLANTDPNRVLLDWNVYSPSLNLASFTSLLGDRKKVAAKKPSKNQLGKMSSQIDDLLEKSRVDVTLKADNILYKKLNASAFSGNIVMLQDRYLINNISMNLAGGNMAMNGQLVNEGSAKHRATLVAAMKNVDVSKVFYAFDEFGQKAITSSNLEGALTTNINAALLLDNGGKVIPYSASGTVDFSLKNGALNNFEPIKKIQRFVFKKRDFDNIRFAEIKNKFEIKNGDIKIPRMEIQSSVLSLFAEGIYSAQNATDISIQVPLSNLKKRDEDYNPENIGTDKKTGRSIFLRGRTGSDGNINFKLDLFNKFKKEKNNSDSSKVT